VTGFANQFLFGRRQPSKNAHIVAGFSAMAAGMLGGRRSGSGSQVEHKEHTSKESHSPGIGSLADMGSFQLRTHSLAPVRPQLEALHTPQ